MTRKHYKMIAETLSTAIDERWSTEVLAKKLAWAFERDNGNFSRDMFLSAVGLPVEER